ncbi:MAG: PepSY domain-containing protein [Alphaproteobacteria bacterium]|nr:MAG: PepSY domain-containing protein [Alphaproteobacteria bacterium]
MKLPEIPRALSKAMLDGHSLVGILMGALIYLVCFSGTLAVLTAEFGMWEAPEGPFIDSVSPELYATVGQSAYEVAHAAGYDHAVYVVAPTPENPRLMVTGYDDFGGYRQWMANADGTLTDPPHTPWTEFMRYHHYNLHLPGMVGYYVVGLIGSLLIASLISGVIAHRRILKDAFRLRLGGTGRLANADLHNRIGVWALPFHLIVSLTGSLLGLAGLLIGMVAFAAYDGNQDKAWEILFPAAGTEDHSPAPVPDIRPILADLETRTPGTEIVWIGYDHVGTKGQAVLLATAEPGHLSRSEMWTYGGDGQFRVKAGYTDGTAGMRIYGMLAPLHFGTYGGLALKLVYMVLGAGLTIIVATGINIWLARKRTQGYAVPHFERAWGVFVWGQFAAFALAGVLEIAGLAPALPVYWAATLLPIIAALWLKVPAADLVRLVQTAGGVLLAVLAVGHVAAWGLVSLDAFIIDSGFFLLGLLLIRRAARTAIPAPRPQPAE